MEKGILQGLTSFLITLLMKLLINIVSPLILSIILVTPVLSQNCSGLNVIGSFYDLPSGTPPNYAAAQSSGLCYELTPPYPSQICFEYMIPNSDTVRATFHLSACGSLSSIGTGTYSGGCSGTVSTNATFIGQSTYDNNCNLIGNYIAVGYCGGATSGDIMTICFDLNTSSSCDPITICPMLFCNTSICSTALPIELLSFEANCNSNNIVLNWSTISEINNDYYVIEKSLNGIDFFSISTIQGSGNSNQLLKYSIVDDELSEKQTYYRLKQVDFDGAYNYSNIISSNCVSSDFNIYPNPASNTINISLTGTDKSKPTAKIYNPFGKLVHQEELNSLTNSINIQYLANGVYLVQLIDNNRILTSKKIIKQ